MSCFYISLTVASLCRDLCKTYAETDAVVVFLIVLCVYDVWRFFDCFMKH